VLDNRLPDAVEGLRMHEARNNRRVTFLEALDLKSREAPWQHWMAGQLVEGYSDA
jgi:hypothetical protein